MRCIIYTFLYNQENDFNVNWFYLRKSASKTEVFSKILLMIQKLEADTQSSEFHNPVDFLRLGLTDYCMIIKTPMDLSTVKVFRAYILEKN